MQSLRSSFFKLPKSSNDLQKQSLGLPLGHEELIYVVVRFSGRHVLPSALLISQPTFLYVLFSTWDSGPGNASCQRLLYHT